MSPADQSARRVLVSASAPMWLGAAALQVLIFVGSWGNSRALFLLAVFCTVSCGANACIERWGDRRLGVPGTENARAALNVVSLAAVGTVTHWSLPTWAFVAYFAFASDGLRDPQVGRRVALATVTLDLFAILQGASLAHAALFSILAAAAYSANHLRAGAMRSLFDETLEQKQGLETAHAELREVHRRALAQDKLAALGLLAAGIAHEINNPMGFVTSNLSSLALDLKDFAHDPTLLKEYEEDVIPATLGGIKRVNAIVADLGRFARTEPETFASVDLNAEVSTALRIAHSQLKHRAELRTNLGSIPPLWGRGPELSQVVLNLVMNAAQALPDTRVGSVEVSTEQARGGVLLRVIDDGIGMSPDTLKRLFQPFFTTKPVGQGTGLGLAVTHGIIQSHGGRIDVRSELGRGATFEIWLPVMAEQAQAAA